MSDKQQNTATPDLSGFALEYPHPLFRVSGDDTIDFANGAAAPLLRRLEAQVGDRLTGEAAETLSRVRESGLEDSFILEKEERAFRLEFFPSKSGGSAIHVCARDVTQQVSFQRQQEMLARFPEENPNPVLRANRDGGIEFANLPATDLLLALGAHLGELPAAWGEAFNRAKSTGEPVEFESEVEGAHFLNVVTPVEDYDYLYVYGKDITKIRQAELALVAAKEAAEAASKTKSSFLANMSHELRTPLNAIIGYSELLIEDAEDDGNNALLPDLQKIRTAGRHLLSLINEILDLSKIEAGKMELYVEPFSLKDLVEQVTNLAAPLASQKKNTLKVEFGDTGQLAHDEMRADVTKVRQILVNLMSNAAKFTENGEVILRVVSDDQEVVFSVEDSGIGMEAEVVGKLFQPFTQADSSTTRRFGGTGLGLTISKRFCEMMQGTISVESIPGRGSIFRVQMPRRIDEESPERDIQKTGAAWSLHEEMRDSQRSLSSHPPVGLGNGESRATILSIDDDPAVLELLGRFLSAEGFLVQTAGSGPEGLALAQTLQPDAITLDVMMPQMDGWSVLAQLKRDPRTAQIPVFMVTIVDEKKVGVALGAADYLTKPIDRDRLLGVLHEHLIGEEGPILVVDDEADVREYSRRALEREGFEVQTAENGVEALSSVQKDRPSLILLDLMMPEMNGFEFIEQLRSNPAYGDLPVIVVTAMDLSPEDRSRLEGYVQDTIEKGGRTAEQLAGTIRDITLRRASRRPPPPSRSR